MRRAEFGYAALVIFAFVVCRYVAPHDVEVRPPQLRLGSPSLRALETNSVDFGELEVPGEFAAKHEVRK